MDLKSKIILISGPTASGKSKFSIQLAKKIKGEIINADSMQIYKELKILICASNCGFNLQASGYDIASFQSLLRIDGKDNDSEN